MTNAQPAKRSTLNAGLRGKGTYASRACNVCKRKKIKCDETKPVCGSCESSGRNGECAWTGESARKPRTEAHFEAMRRRADALERYANILESMLDKCQREHGGTFKDGQSYLQFRPRSYRDDKMEYEDLGDKSASDGDPDDTPTAEICISAQNLTLGERDLVLYGNAAPFRFAKVVSTLPKHNPVIDWHVKIDLNTPYMLLVDEAAQTHYNPHFDWSRYLPSQVPLDRKEHDRILDLLFKFFTSWCMRIVPVLFLRDMSRYLSVNRSETPPNTSHYSPMLHNALLAVAAGFSDHPEIRDYKARKCFADEAKRLMESEVQRPNVSVVHALSMLGSFHSSSGEQGLGYVYFGIGSRVSQALGLNVDCSAWVKSGLITTHDMHDRNWAYWTTFTQEMCWCLYVGRDFNLLTPTEEGSIPVPYVDAEYDQIPWEHPSANIAPQPNYLSTTFAATCELMKIAKAVTGVVNSLHVSSQSHPREGREEQISSIDLQLHAWKGRLPAEIDITLSNKNTSTPHKLVLHLSFWWTFILLHRPFFLHRKRLNAVSKVIDHVKLCKRAADNIMDLLEIYRALYTLRYVPITPIQIVFAAGTIYVLLAVQATTGLRVAKKELETYVNRAELCIQYLMEIGQSWKCASDIADILKDLIVTQLEPVLERKSVSTIPRKKNRINSDLDPSPSGHSVEGDSGTMDTSSVGLHEFPSAPSDSGFDDNPNSYSDMTFSFPESSFNSDPQHSTSHQTFSASTIPLSMTEPVQLDYLESLWFTSSSICPQFPPYAGIFESPTLDSSASITSLEIGQFLQLTSFENAIEHVHEYWNEW
ncbi:fungal-specific transcription factor domain-containing protein [Lentinula raphanica]|nr:fungal-specific transcription factor domain-containing protein [Lentinula raphanica]KAJ3974428.1 fungal-specific transcription factor domain-containing protein [Lentinula raphanica]